MRRKGEIPFDETKGNRPSRKNGKGKRKRVTPDT